MFHRFLIKTLADKKKVRMLPKTEIQPMLYLKVTYATAALKLIVTPSLSVRYGITWVVKFPRKGYRINR